MKLSSQDLKLITVASLFSAGALYLWATYTTKFDSRNLESIAFIDNTISDVRWKVFGNFDWIRPEKGAGLVSGDQIFTGKDSVAVIEFKKNNSKIVLMENSLVTIQEDADKIIFDIQKGSFEIKNAPDSNLIIKNKGQVQELPKITENVLIKSDKSGIKTQEVAVKIPSIAFPTNQFEYKALEAKAVRLSNLFNGVLEISGDASFSSVIKSIPVSNKSTIDDIGLKERGEYFLRLNRENKFSNVVNVSVTSLNQIAQISPSIRQEIILARGENLKFTWEKTESKVNKVKIYKAGDFVKEVNGQEDSADVFLNAGDDYSWRVEGYANNKLVGQSEDFPFSVYYKNFEVEQPKVLTDNIEKNPLEINLPLLPSETARVQFYNKGVLIKEYLADKKKFLVNDLSFGHYSVHLNSNLYRSKASTIMEAFVRGAAVSFNGIKKNNVDTLTYVNSYESFSEKGLVPVSFHKNIDALDENGISLTINGKLRSKRVKLDENQFVVGLDGYGEYCLSYKVSTPIDREVFRDAHYCFKHLQLKHFPSLAIPQDQILNRDGVVKIETYTINLPANEKAQEYRIQIFGDKELKEQIFTAKSKSNQINWSSKRSGIFYYRYQLVDKDNNESEFSDIARIIFPISPFSDWSGNK